ncbi:MAG: ABC transporter ATP-binding protein [Desulfobacterales bacterium]|nr:ABC transporter ATP-binding protein [Desulfobacterales bacterium]
MQTVVDIEELSHFYGSFQALRELSFSVPKGCFFIVIGPNGSGKTTLLKTLAGIAAPASGAVSILGRPIERYTRKGLAKRLAFVPQLPSEEFPFRVRDIVLMGRSPHLGVLGLDREADRGIARQAMEFTGVESFSARRLEQLSGGERQRVFIARAICQEPEILLLDEPTAALDLAHQVRIMDLMERLKKDRGVTVIMVSHDVNLAAMYADRLLLMREGAMVSIGSPAEVLTYEVLEKTYECPLLVDESPLGGVPRVTVVPRRYMDSDRVPLAPDRLDNSD